MFSYLLTVDIISSLLLASTYWSQYW